ncbi:hypothetical protein BHE74_00000955 [Ensete ventricosum]|nr:hypothetical protein BHE74_00000955 [Ensete ventricosum]
MAAIRAARRCHARRMPRENHHACCSIESCTATGAARLRGCVSGRPALVHGDRDCVRDAAGQGPDYWHHRGLGGGLAGGVAFAGQWSGGRLGGFGVRVGAPARHVDARADSAAGGLPATGGGAPAPGLLVSCYGAGGGLRHAGGDRCADCAVADPRDARWRAQAFRAG